MSVSDKKVTTSWIVEDGDIYAAQIAQSLTVTAAHYLALAYLIATLSIESLS